MEKITYANKVQGGGTVTGRWRDSDANEVKTKFNLLVDGVEDLADDLAGHDHTASEISDFNTSVDARITAQKGAANGVVPLGSDLKIASTYLPSYVDDVIEAATYAALPATGETGKIYVTLNNNKEYRWSGSVYVELVASPGSTDAVTEGSSNKYFTEPRVLATILAGLTAAGSRVLPASTDSLLTAFGKILKYLTDLGALAYVASTSAALDLISSTRGTVLFRGASGWSVLAPGTSGQLLQTDGSGADPGWATLIPIVSLPASGTSNTLTCTALDNRTSVTVLTGNVTFTSITLPANATLVIFYKQAATGGPYTVTFPGTIIWPGGTAPSMPSTASKYLRVTLTSDGTSIHGNYSTN